MDMSCGKFDLQIEKSDLRFVFDKLLKAQLLTEAEYKKIIEKLSSHTIKENLC